MEYYNKKWSNDDDDDKNNNSNYYYFYSNNSIEMQVYEKSEPDEFCIRDKHICTHVTYSCESDE